MLTSHTDDTAAVSVQVLKDIAKLHMVINMTVDLLTSDPDLLARSIRGLESALQKLLEKMNREGNKQPWWVKKYISVLDICLLDSLLHQFVILFVYWFILRFIRFFDFFCSSNGYFI